MTRQAMKQFAEEQILYYQKDIEWCNGQIARINEQLKRTRKEDKAQKEFARTYEGGKLMYLYEGNWQGEETRKLLNARRRYQREIKHDMARIEQYKHDIIKYTDRPQEAPQTAPAAEAEQQPTETENAPQAATQAAEGTTTDEQKDEENAVKQYKVSSNRPCDGQRVENITCNYDVAVQLAKSAQDAGHTAIAIASTEEEEENTMSNNTTTERYDYLEHMTADVIDAIRERYTDDEIRSRLDDDRDELTQELNDDLWTDDSVTGNASGSYYCNAWRAEDAIAHNWDLIADMIDEFDAADILRKGPEAIDVSIRCYLLGRAIDAALDQLDDEIPKAEEPDEDDGTNDADAIGA